MIVRNLCVRGVCVVCVCVCVRVRARVRLQSFVVLQQEVHILTTER